MHCRIIGGWVCMLLLLTGCKRNSQTTADGQGSEMIVLSTMDTAAIKTTIDNTRKIQTQYPDSARGLYKSLYERSRQMGYRKGAMLSVFHAGRIDIAQGDYKNGTGKYLLAISYADTVRNRAFLADMYNFLGSAYNAQGKFDEAIQAYYKAIYYSPYVLDAYNNVASVLGQLRQYEKAKAYIDRALSIAIYEKRYSLWAALLLNKASCYDGLGRQDSNKIFTDSGIAVARRHNISRELAMGLVNRGYYYINKNESAKALNDLLEAMRLTDSAGVAFREKNDVALSIGRIYLKRKEYKLAENYLLEVQKNTAQLPQEHIGVLQELSALYAGMNNYPRAYQLRLEADAIKDTLLDRDAMLRVSELEARYKTLDQDKVISKDRLRIAKSNVLLLSITITALVIIMLLSWIYLYKNRKLKSDQELERIKAIMEGEEKERSRLAHDLHDGVNSQLTAVKSFLLAVQKEHPYLLESKNFNHAKSMLTETASDIRKVVHNLVPDDLIQKGLATVVEDFCAGIFAGKDMNTDVQVYGEFKGISISLSLTIYRLVQELLHNIVKHAHATSVTVLLSRMDEEISLIVEDNGIGIPVNILNNSDTDGIGLSGIRDRVQAYNGQLSIESESGKGTVVSITFQVHPVSYKEKVSRY